LSLNAASPRSRSDREAEDAIHDSEAMRRVACVELGDDVVPVTRCIATCAEIS
jgi:hypothetical protein